jgi:hypothetical protein
LAGKEFPNFLDCNTSDAFFESMEGEEYADTIDPYANLTGGSQGHVSTAFPSKRKPLSPNVS